MDKRLNDSANLLLTTKNKTKQKNQAHLLMEVQKNFHFWRRRSIIMGHFGCCDVLLCSLGQAVNLPLWICNTEMQQQPGLPVISFHGLLSFSFMGWSLGFFICGSVESSCLSPLDCNSMLTETFCSFPLESTALPEPSTLHVVDPH